jgi:hypothetical protein
MIDPVACGWKASTGLALLALEASWPPSGSIAALMLSVALPGADS